MAEGTDHDKTHFLLRKMSDQRIVYNEMITSYSIKSSPVYGIFDLVPRDLFNSFLLFLITSYEDSGHPCLLLCVTKMSNITEVFGDLLSG